MTVAKVASGQTCLYGTEMETPQIKVGCVVLISPLTSSVAGITLSIVFTVVLSWWVTWQNKGDRKGHQPRLLSLN